MMNPVLRREAITTMRTWKTYGALVVFLAISAIGAGFFIYVSMFQNYDLSFDPSLMVYLYVVLAAVQMGLVLLTAPAIAAGSISGERERQTLDLLLVTKMRPISIVMGKMLSSLAYVLLLVVSTMPVFAIAFYFGSISMLHVLQLMAFVLCSACMVGAISVYFSCKFKKTIVSIVLMYLVIGVLCFGTLLLLAFVYLSSYQIFQGEVPLLTTIVILLPNPGVGFFSMIDAQLGSNITGSLLAYSDQTGPILTWAAEHMWLLNICFDAVITVLFIWLSARAIDPMRESKVKSKKVQKVSKGK